MPVNTEIESAVGGIIERNERRADVLKHRNDASVAHDRGSSEAHTEVRLNGADSDQRLQSSHRRDRLLVNTADMLNGRADSAMNSAKEPEAQRSGVSSPNSVIPPKGQTDLDNSLGIHYLPPVRTANLHEISDNVASSPAYKRPGKAVEEKAQEEDKGKIYKKLSPAQIHDLTSSPESLSLHVLPQTDHNIYQNLNGAVRDGDSHPLDSEKGGVNHSQGKGRLRSGSAVVSPTFSNASSNGAMVSPHSNDAPQLASSMGRPAFNTRTASTPASSKRPHLIQKPSGTGHLESITSKSRRIVPAPLPLDTPNPNKDAPDKSILSSDPAPSPMPQTIPLPPLSLPTYLQLELSSSRPSPLYIHRSMTSEFPYESSRVKFERLQNFLLLPPNLEGVLWFGTLACLDAWLYTFTILPLRFMKAIVVLGKWWGQTLLQETKDIAHFIYLGLGRMWYRRRLSSQSARNSTTNTPNGAASRSRKGSGSASWDSMPNPNLPLPPIASEASFLASQAEIDRRRKRDGRRRHRRTKSTPSALLPSHKADILKGLVVLFSCLILTRFDASRMYHGIRGQAAIKLYVLYNVLEVCDRLFSALGQDVFECLFSRETLDRNSDGRSKVLRPFAMFCLALTYNVIHSTALFYQVITLNVAVNSYSNALLTLLTSNQFVEIKSTVFKKFEKENLFQLTCADVVERFQLWHMLMIIALRNLVEVGLPTLGLGLGSGGVSSFGADVSKSLRSGILPKSFTLFPKWSGQLFGPFFLVLGSEMLVDWLKHAYITKFNNTKPAIYGRFLDVLSKDYYSNAFADQNLTRRLGLPVIPLSCLFIRASLQTYHMFLSTHMPLPIPSTATSLSETATPPATTAALQHVDTIIRRALGRSTFGGGGGPESSTSAVWWWNLDDVIAFSMMLIFLLIAFLVLLAVKLLLGMLLLSFARRRYKQMKEQERDGGDSAAGRRIGGWGVVEVDEDKKRWIYKDDPAGAKASREREKVMREREARPEVNFGGVSRYTMVAKRIW